MYIGTGKTLCQFSDVCCDSQMQFVTIDCDNSYEVNWDLIQLILSYDKFNCIPTDELDRISCMSDKISCNSMKICPKPPRRFNATSLQ